MLAYAGLSEAKQRERYPSLKGHDLSVVVAEPGADGPLSFDRFPARSQAVCRAMDSIFCPVVMVWAKLLQVCLEKY